jgi:NADH:ubiquinone oxidoreductase subunit 5 (subunit L)/multisubunit Na+/H+ antiporter MnhA subunit
LSILTFALGGIALMGVQPGGAYLAKELLLQAATDTGQWWWEVALQAGGMFTAAYVVLVLAHATAPSDKPIVLTGPGLRLRDMAPLVLALCSLVLGLIPWGPYLPVPGDMTPSFFGPGALAKLLIPVLGGVVLAILFSPWPHPLASSTIWKPFARVIAPVRYACVALGTLIERGNDILCQWSAASISLLSLALAFGLLMLAA